MPRVLHAPQGGITRLKRGRCTRRQRFYSLLVENFSGRKKGHSKRAEFVEKRVEKRRENVCAGGKHFPGSRLPPPKFLPKVIQGFSAGFAHGFPQ